MRVGAAPEGAHVMRGLSLEPDAGALLEDHDLVARWEEWLATRERFEPPNDAARSGA